MKLRYLIIVMILVLSLAFAAGCSKKAEPAPAAPVEPAAEPTGPTPEEQTAATTTEEPTAETTTEESKIVEVPETEMGPGIVTDEDIQSGDYKQHSLLGEPQNSDSEQARDLTEEPERFSNFDCQLDAESGIRYISVKVTNTNSDESFMISPIGIAKGYNTYFMVRGIVDKDPGCAVEELGPGESTVCTKIGQADARYGNPAGTNRVTIQSPDNNGKMVPEAVVVNCPEGE